MDETEPPDTPVEIMIVFKFPGESGPLIARYTLASTELERLTNHWRSSQTAGVYTAAVERGSSLKSPPTKLMLRFDEVLYIG